MPADAPEYGKHVQCRPSGAESERQYDLTGIAGCRADADRFSSASDRHGMMQKGSTFDLLEPPASQNAAAIAIIDVRCRMNGMIA